MSSVLVLGAGLVARPLVNYLLNTAGYDVTVASRTVSKAEALVDGHERGKALTLNVKDEDQLSALVKEADLSISLVPYAYHPTVARLCIEHRKPMVTTSYVGKEMQDLDRPAKEAGVLLLNEIGLDPGIDHMSAMKIIHDVQKKGGRIASFRSYCGGLPAPEANTNPWGYKFSWSPKGVILAGKNTARYLEDGKEVNVPGPDLFAHHWKLDIKGHGEFEAYPNRDSVPYGGIYGIDDSDTVFRGTLRNPGWCDTWKALVDLGWLDDGEKELSGATHASLFADLAGVDKGGDLGAAVASKLGIEPTSHIIEKYRWLGLLEDQSLEKKKAAPLDILADLLLEKCQYEPDEQDMIVLFHDFIAEYPEESRKERITSTFVDYGIPGGDSAMARTVSLPAAMATRMILEGKIRELGVRIPISPAIYNPILEELETESIKCLEATTPL